jgi:hypothetical protein
MTPIHEASCASISILWSRLRSISPILFLWVESFNEASVDSESKFSKDQDAGYSQQKPPASQASQKTKADQAQ